MFKAHSAGQPLKLKVLEGTHGTDPMGLQGGQVGLEKLTKKSGATSFDKNKFIF